MVDVRISDMSAYVDTLEEKETLFYIYILVLEDFEFILRSSCFRI